MRTRLLLSISALSLLGCHETPVTAPSATAARPGTASLPHPGARGVTFMTRNLYLGASFSRVTAEGVNIVTAAAETWAMVQSTDFPARAELLAREIATTQPHIVGLQEVVTYRTRVPFNPAMPAENVAYDFLALLLAALEREGVSYVEVATQKLTDVELPALDVTSPTFLKGVRYTDHDVIIARRDVVASGLISDAAGGVYENLHTYSVGGFPVQSRRGWTAVTATIAGNRHRVINSHLEIQEFDAIQEGQAKELIALAGRQVDPVVLLGDFNSAADGSQTSTYGLLMEAGYIDAWNQAHPDDPGYTCCFAEDLRDRRRTPDQRIDFVLVRDPSWPQSRILGAVHAEITGRDPDQASGLWASDHAGVVATLRTPPALAAQ